MNVYSRRSKALVSWKDCHTPHSIWKLHKNYKTSTKFISEAPSFSHISIQYFKLGRNDREKKRKDSTYFTRKHEADYKGFSEH